MAAETTLNGELPLQNGTSVDTKNAEVHEFTKKSVANPVSITCDVLVVGGGFSGSKFLFQDTRTLLKSAITVQSLPYTDSGSSE